MHEFTCGHQECGSQFTSSDKDVLMRQVADHLKEAHAVPTATQTLLSYLETMCVKTVPDR
jgi:predicted small metal-binding protein